jgi:hypothetical protein
LVLTACGSLAGFLAADGGQEQEQKEAEEDAKAQQELDALNQEIRLIISQAEELPDGKNKERVLREFNEKISSYKWPRDATEIKRKVQALKDWVAEAQKMAAAEAAKQAEATKQAEEQRLAANARGVTEADFTVDVTQDGKGVIITYYKGAATEVKIPASIQGFPVRVIGEGAFSGTTITSVVIPEGVTYVDGFSDCKQLAQVTLPSTLSYIGAEAFKGTALKAVVIPRGVTGIGGGAFEGCTSLASVTIPNSVTEIGYGAFSGCTSLASVTIQNGVRSIGGEAFSGCTSLASVTIQNGVKEIGHGAFSGCTSLASVTIPDSVTAISGGAFEGCTSLTTVTISPVKRNWIYVDRHVFYDCPKLSLASQAALRAAGYTGGF